MTNQEKLESIGLVGEFAVKLIAICIFFYLFTIVARDVRDISNSLTEISNSLNIPKEFATRELPRPVR